MKFVEMNEETAAGLERIAAELGFESVDRYLAAIVSKFFCGGCSSTDKVTPGSRAVA